MVRTSEWAQAHIFLFDFLPSFGPTDEGYLSRRRRWFESSRRSPLSFSVRGHPDGRHRLRVADVIGAEKQKAFDVFVVYTDWETWFGNVHPSQALHNYRETMGIDAKLIVVGMVANGFTITDPNDAGMLEVVGFDTAAPDVMSDFARGNV